MTTYDLDAFEQPTFSGALVKAHQVIDVVAQGEEVLDQTKSRFDIATGRLSDLLVLLAEPNPDPREAGTVILHVSDIHANPIGFQITRQLAREFDVDAILDTGDIASAELDTGEISTAIDPIDSAIARELRRADVPYLYVAGNHDSPQLRRRVGEDPNVEVLDDSTVTLGNVTILGWADPTFSTKPVPEEEKARQRLEAAPKVAEAVAETDPDLLAVHDSRLASDSLGDVPVVLAGHTHERFEATKGGTLILTVGSTGATGLKHLTFEAGRDYEAEVLYFEGDDLVAVDYMSFEDIGGDFELSRRTYDGSDGDE
jgi:predicted phosphodiesterase